ncbi:MAG: hypothetical protein NUW37_13040 [Planctomycetes bacterium]|nr:hypothetical protein [Planctomycetota bacterium]
MLALSEFASKRGEFDVDYDLVIKLGGNEVKRVRVTRENLFTFDSEIVLDGADIPLEEVFVTIAKVGRGQVYASAYLDYFSKEEHIGASSNEIEVRREYYLVNRGGREELAQPEKIEEGREIESRDEIEVRLHVKGHNDYEYVVFEDFKPAGCEPRQLRSGFAYGSGVWANVELRDEKVAFFATRLPEGEYVLTYRLIAEIPGKFHALPAQGSAMYALELRANSESFIMTIVE